MRILLAKNVYLVLITHWMCKMKLTKMTVANLSVMNDDDEDDNDDAIFRRGADQDIGS